MYDQFGNRSMETIDKSKDKGALRVICLACFVALACPFLFGYGTLPLTNFAGEIVSTAGFAMLLLLAAKYGALGGEMKDLKLVLLAIAILDFATLVQYFYTGGMNSMAWATVIGYFMLAAMAAWVGASARAGQYKWHWQVGMAIGLVAGASFASLGSLAQYVSFDASWIVLSPAAETGRTFGFIRQPNHQATFLCIGLASIFVLQITHPRRSTTILLFLLSPLLVFGIISTGSRTAMLEMLFITVSGFVFLRRAPNGVLKALYPLVWAAVIWGVLFVLNQHGVFDFYGNNKLHQTTSEGVGVRSEVWHQTLDLIRSRLWFGWGLLDYGAVFFLSGAAEKAGIVMVHSHNLFLQFLFAFGLPVTLVFFVLISVVLWRARHQLLMPDGLFPFLIIGCIFIHSQVEFPLWYTYFLLPTFFSLGWLARGDGSGESLLPARPQRKLLWFYSNVFKAPAKGFGVMVSVGAILVTIWINQDYYRLTPVYAPGLKYDLDQRLEVASKVTWFQEYFQYLDLIRRSVDASNYRQYIADAASLGCVNYQSWHQVNTIVALAYAGNLDEAKWILYSYWRLSGGHVGQFVDGLTKSKAPLAVELLDYLKNPVPVVKATQTFDAVCSGKKVEN